MKYQDLAFLLVVCVLILSVIKGCEANKELERVNESFNRLYKENAGLHADYNDTLLALHSDLMLLEMQLEDSVLKYKSKPAKERVKYILRIDTLAQVTDSSATLSLQGIDSINVLALSYQNCMAKSAVKDTIITLQTNIIKADSITINSMHKLAKSEKKAAKIKIIKAAVLSAVFGLLIGLVL